MTTQITFSHQVQYQSRDHPDYPSVIGLLEANDAPNRVVLFVDTGCQFTIFRTDTLRPLGFVPRSQDEIVAAEDADDLESIGCKRLTGAGPGGGVVGCEFNLTLSIENGPQNIAMTVYGDAFGALLRNLLGRDYFEMIDTVAIDQTARITYLEAG